MWVILKLLVTGGFSTGATGLREPSEQPVGEPKKDLTSKQLMNINKDGIQMTTIKHVKYNKSSYTYKKEIHTELHTILKYIIYNVIYGNA